MGLVRAHSGICVLLLTFEAAWWCDVRPDCRVRIEHTVASGTGFRSIRLGMASSTGGVPFDYVIILTVTIGTAIEIIIIILDKCFMGFRARANPFRRMWETGVALVAGNSGRATLQVLTVADFARGIIEICRCEKCGMGIRATAIFPARRVGKISVTFVTGDAGSATL